MTKTSKRMTALLLALTLSLALGVNAASAEEGAPVADAAETAVADAAGTLSFANLDGRMRENYYPLLALQENIQTLEEWDYQRTENDLRDALNAIANQQGNYFAIPGIGSMMSASLQPQYDAYRKAFDDVQSGKLQADNEGVKRQLKNLQDQTVIVGESLYLTLSELETRDAALGRTIASLERREKELALRCELGQVSALTVQQLRAGLTQAESGRETLRMNRDNILLQLKAMVGVALDEKLTLSTLPPVTAEQLAAMALDADLEKAKAASYELYDAQKTRDDAKKDFDDARKKYGEYSKKNEWMQAKHTWQAAQYTYENAVQSYELKFRALYAQVKDANQALDAARVSLASGEREYAAAALKHRQGSVSANTLADARDTLAEAEDALANAERALLTQYRAYQWAVERGILNS